MSAKGANIQLKKDLNRDDNLLFAEGGSRIIFSICKMKQNEWLNYLKQNQANIPSSVYIKKIGHVSSEILNIKIQDKNICNIRVEELSEKFNKNNIIVAYEPIWSIGTGKIPTANELKKTTIHNKKSFKRKYNIHG